MLNFYDDHKVQFTYIALEIEKRAAYTFSDTYCELFFNISGYVLSPKWARIGVINYEETEMLCHNMQLVYIDEDWVVKKYLRRVK